MRFSWYKTSFSVTETESEAEAVPRYHLTANRAPKTASCVRKKRSRIYCRLGFLKIDRSKNCGGYRDYRAHCPFKPKYQRQHSVKKSLNKRLLSRTTLVSAKWRFLDKQTIILISTKERRRRMRELRAATFQLRKKNWVQVIVQKSFHAVWGLKDFLAGYSWMKKCGQWRRKWRRRRKAKKKTWG